MENLLISLRESKNRLAQLAIAGGELSVADTVAVVSDNVIEELMKLVHSRDKLAMMDVNDVRGAPLVSGMPFVIVNTSIKSKREQASFIVISENGAQLKEASDVGVDDNILGMFVMLLEKTSASFTRF